ncbi:MAG TPA: hypothetical protein VGO45_13435 [Bacteroidia bacterium]|jgi:hypothetical protein|nr:hypothetical protein [Bacteroidia bacterium]
MNPALKTAYIPEVAHAEPADLRKGIFLVILHASRIPPHIGMLFNGAYHSLNVKGRDIAVPLEALLKNITLRKLPALFVEVKTDSQNQGLMSEAFISQVQRFNRVDVGVATCLSPIRLFFEERLHLNVSDIHYLWQLIPLLQEKEIIGKAYGFFLQTDPDQGFCLPQYTMEEINKGIEQVRNEYKN